MKSNNLLEKTCFSKCLSEVSPLCLNYFRHHVLFEHPDKIVHLVPDKVNLPKLRHEMVGHSPEFSGFQVFPQVLQLLRHSFQFNQEKEDLIILLDTLVSNEKV